MSAKADKNKSAHRAHFLVKWLLLQPLYRVCQSGQKQIGAKRIQLGQIARLGLLYHDFCLWKIVAGCDIIK